MRFAVLALASVACTIDARRVQSVAEDEHNALASLLFALNAPVQSRSGAQRNFITSFRNRAGLAAMAEEPSESATTVGAAAAGATLGVFFQQDILTVGLLALAAAYASTLSNDLGDATKSVGSFAAKAYDKTKDINEEYDVLPKAKNAADTVFTAADNLNKNYGLTDKLDEKLLLSEKVDKVKDKVDDIRTKFTDKVDDLKSKASSA